MIEQARETGQIDETLRRGAGHFGRGPMAATLPVDPSSAFQAGSMQYSKVKPKRGLRDAVLYMYTRFIELNGSGCKQKSIKVTSKASMRGSKYHVR